ncbi:MAG: HAD family hydrolase [Thermoproteota archaeon]
MIKAVLFDLDGTLIEFNYDYGLAKKIVIAKLIEIGVDRGLLSESVPTALNVEKAITFLRDKGLSEEELRFMRRSIYEAVEPLELKAASNPIPREGVLEILKWLKGLGVRMAVCTNNCDMASDIILRKTLLKGLFDGIFTRNDVDRLKPFPDILIKACESLNVLPMDAVHIGDAPIDIIAAKSAGIVSIGIVSRLCNAELLRAAGAELVASNMKELKQLLSGLV